MNYSAEPPFKRKQVSSHFELGIFQWLKNLDRKKLSFFISIFTVVVLLGFGYKVILRNQGKAVSVNVNYPEEKKGYCNRAALYSAVSFLGDHGASKHNPKLYTELLNTAKVQTVPAVSWTNNFNQIDPLSSNSTGQWVASYDDYTRVNDTNYVVNVLKEKILQSLNAHRPVIVGNGLYRKSPTSTHPGHFYFITSYDENTGIFGLQDGVRMANRKFTIKSLNKGDGSLTSILNQGPNANLDYNWTKNHSVIIFYQPVQPVQYWTSASDPNRTLAAIPANRSRSVSVDMTTFLDSSIDPPSGATWGSGGTEGWQGSLNAWSLNGTQSTGGSIKLAATAPIRDWRGVITKTYSCPPSCLATGTLSLTVAPSPADTYQWKSVSVNADIPTGTSAVLSSVSNGVTKTSGDLTGLPASQSITLTLTLKSNRGLTATPTIRSVNLNYDTIIDAPDGVQSPVASAPGTTAPGGGQSPGAGAPGTSAPPNTGPVIFHTYATLGVNTVANAGPASINSGDMVKLAWITSTTNVTYGTPTSVNIVNLSTGATTPAVPNNAGSKSIGPLTGDQSYKLRACNVYLCVDSNTVKVTVKPLAPAPTCQHKNPSIVVTPGSISALRNGIAQYTATITNNDTALCTGSTFTLGVTGLPTVSSTAYLPQPSAAISPGTANGKSIGFQISVGPNVPFGTYPLTFKATGSSGTGSATANLIVNSATLSPPVPSPSPSPRPTPSPSPTASPATPGSVPPTVNINSPAPNSTFRTGTSNAVTITATASVTGLSRAVLAYSLYKGSAWTTPYTILNTVNFPTNCVRGVACQMSFNVPSNAISPAGATYLALAVKVYDMIGNQTSVYVTVVPSN